MWPIQPQSSRAHDTHTHTHTHAQLLHTPALSSYTPAYSSYILEMQETVHLQTGKKYTCTKLLFRRAKILIIVCCISKNR